VSGPAGPGRPEIPSPISEGRIIAIGRHLPADRLVAVARALCDGGVRAFEVTMNSAGAFVAAGAVAVGIGSWLTGDGDVAGIRERARAVVDAVHRARP
jgi:2-keto-3-deoxy-6-phosphogluconate aldolase